MLTVKDLGGKYPLVYKVLGLIAEDNCCSLNNLYAFSDSVLHILEKSEHALSQFDGHVVEDIISIDVVKRAVSQWDARDDKEWYIAADVDALEMVAFGEESYVLALCGAVPCGRTLYSFLSDCFDGYLSSDDAGMYLFFSGGSNDEEIYYEND